MTTLTVTARDEIPAVLLQVAGAPAGAVTLSRSDRNGVGLVRLMPNQVPIAGAMIVYDYEAAIAGTVTYELVDSAAVSTIAGTVTNAAFPHVHAAVLPNAGTSLVAVRDYDSARETSGATHWPILRGDPIVITGPMRTRAGKLEVFAGSFEDAQLVAAAIASGEVCQLRQPTFTGMDMYFLPLRLGVLPAPEDTIPRRWTVALDYQETAAPSGPLLSAAAWDLDDVKAIGTFTTVKATFATFAGLAVGP